MTINMIKKMTQYLLQRRCALSLLLMLMLLQPVMAQTQDPIMYARLNRETQTLTLFMTRISLKGTIKVFPIVPCGKLKLKEKK